MAKSRKTQIADVPEGDVFDAAIAAQQAPGTAIDGAKVNEQEAPVEPYKPAYKPRFCRYDDAQAGVQLRTDFPNKLNTIGLRDEPSPRVVELLEAKRFFFDPDMGVFVKPIKEHAPRAANEEAEELARDVANQIRAEKGLSQKESYFISREGHQGR